MNWLALEDDYYIHVLPEEDIKPHGHPSEDGTVYDIASLDCPCKPTIETGTSDGMYVKPIIHHNSWLEAEIIDRSLEHLSTGQ